MLVSKLERTCAGRSSGEDIVHSSMKESETR